MTVTVDLTGVTTPEALHAKIRQTLALPGWYGNNLDALYDVLSTEPELSVRFVGAAQLRAAAPRYTAALERLCEDLTSESASRRCTVENGGATKAAAEAAEAAAPAPSGEETAPAEPPAPDGGQAEQD